MNPLPFALGVLLASVAVLPAQAQVVQLPTYHSFSVGTTVTVPDRGSAWLGGVSRFYEGSSSRGAPGANLPFAGRLFRDRSYSRAAESAGVGVRATIIDLNALDAATLAQAARQRGGGDPLPQDVDRKAAFLTRHVGRASSSDRTAAARTSHRPPRYSQVVTRPRVAAGDSWNPPLD